jgi:hypothetical protein
MKISFYPLGVMVSQGILFLMFGILVGLQQQLSLNAPMDLCQFGVEIKTHLFIQLISKYLLYQG